MFSRKLRQSNRELRKTVVDLELCIDYKNDEIRNLKEENEHLKMNLEAWRYREDIWEQDREKLNNVISNLMEERNKLTAKKVRKAKKVETISDQTK